MNRRILWLIQACYALPERTWEKRGFHKDGYLVPMGKK